MPTANTARDGSRTASPSPPSAGPAAPARQEPFQPVAAILAVLLPGAGHFYLGHKGRALAILAGVLGLFFGGVFVGGIDVIDRQQEPVWFIGHALVGPVAFGVDAMHQKWFKVFDPAIGKPRSARPDEYRDPDTGRAVPIALSPPGVPMATLKSGRDISPAYPPKVRSVGRMHDLGLLFGAIAGMMNLICVVDAAFRARVTR